MMSWPVLMATAAASLKGDEYSGWTPDGLSPIAWFDAMATDTLTMSGGLISQWDSKVSTCAALAQYSSKPSYTVDLFGSGYPGVYFSSAASIWNFSAFSSNIGTSATIASLWMPNSASLSGRAAPFIGNASILKGVGIGSEEGASESRSYIWGGAEILNSITGNRIDVWTLDAGTSFKLVTNGSLEVSTTTSKVTIGNGYHLGGTGGYQWGSMNLAETLVFNSVLSTADRQKVEGYLAHRWAMTSLLSAAHPYKDAAPT